MAAPAAVSAGYASTDETISNTNRRNIMDTYIIIGTNGFVWVGRMSNMDTKDGFYTIYKARQIREWGTTKGLNQLIAGPTKDTKLDAVAPILFLHQSHAISLIPTDKAGWDKHLQ